jgi:hypothetical protein
MAREALEDKPTLYRLAWLVMRVSAGALSKRTKEL